MVTLVLLMALDCKSVTPHTPLFKTWLTTEERAGGTHEVRVGIRHLVPPSYSVYTYEDGALAWDGLAGKLTYGEGRLDLATGADGKVSGKLAHRYETGDLLDDVDCTVATR